jgi:hypothetical protein
MDEQRILKLTHSHLTQRIKPKLHRIDFLRYVSITACTPQSPSGAWFSHSQARAFPHLSTKSDKMASLTPIPSSSLQRQYLETPTQTSTIGFSRLYPWQWHEPRDSSGPLQIHLQPLSTRVFPEWNRQCPFCVRRVRGRWFPLQHDTVVSRS